MTLAPTKESGLGARAIEEEKASLGQGCWLSKDKPWGACEGGDKALSPEMAAVVVVHNKYWTDA